MATQSSCPDLQDWQRLLLGQVQVAEAEPYHEHLDQCPRCVQIVKALEQEVERKASAPEPLVAASAGSVGDKRLKFSPTSFTVERGKKTMINGVAEKR